MKIDEKIMHERRLDRLKHVKFFLEYGPSMRYLALGSTHNLLAGFFQNSHWRVALYCVLEACKNSWRSFTVELFFFWNQKVLRLSNSEIDRKIDIQSGVRTETCEKCGWVRNRGCSDRNRRIYRCKLSQM